jgi:hypothetical protein
MTSTLAEVQVGPNMIDRTVIVTLGGLMKAVTVSIGSGSSGSSGSAVRRRRQGERFAEWYEVLPGRPLQTTASVGDVDHQVPSTGYEGERCSDRDSTRGSELASVTQAIVDNLSNAFRVHVTTQ